MNFTQRLFAIGTTLFLLYSVLVTFPQLLMLFGIPVGAWELPVSVVISFLAYWMFYRNFINAGLGLDFFLHFFIAIAISASCMELVSQILDTSFDGNWYHQDAMYLLGKGWNPDYEILAESQTSFSDKYLNHFPKSAWVGGAVLYSFSGWIESAKAINMVLLFSGLFIGIYFFRRVFGFNLLLSTLLGTVAATNPILVMNLFNDYADGQVAALFLIAVYFGVLQVKDAGWVMGFLSLLALALLANIKFTSGAYALVLLTGGMLYLLGTKAYTFRKLLAIGSLWGIFAYGVLGFNPYLTNTIRKGHPLYPMSEGSENVFSRKAIYPANFFEMNWFEKFITSFYAEPAWSRTPQECHPKKLFSHSNLNIYSGGMPEVAALGPVTPEAFTLLIPLFLWAFYKLSRKQKLAFVVFSGIICLTLLINPEAWVIRYVPQFWILIIGMLAIAFKDTKSMYPAWIILAALLINNFLLGRTYISGSIESSNKLRQQLEYVASHQKELDIYNGWTLTFKNRLGAFGVDTGNLVYIPDTDTSSVLFYTSLGARYRKRTEGIH